jgi:hypothetical protein
MSDTSSVQMTLLKIFRDGKLCRNHGERAAIAPSGLGEYGLEAEPNALFAARFRTGTAPCDSQSVGVQLSSDRGAKG